MLPSDNQSFLLKAWQILNARDFGEGHVGYWFQFWGTEFHYYEPIHWFWRRKRNLCSSTVAHFLRWAASFSLLFQLIMLDGLGRWRIWRTATFTSPLENSSLAGPNLSENFLKVSKTLIGGSRTQKPNNP